MYEKATTGWAKHLDFIILDMICLELSFVLAYMIRHGFGNPYGNVMYRDMGIFLLFLDFAMLLFMETLRDVLRRGIYREFVRTLRHVVVFMLVLSMYMFVTQEGSIYSRITIFVMSVIYFFLTYVIRLAWKNYVKHRALGKTETTLLIISSEKRSAEIMESVQRNSYGRYHIVGWVFHDEYKVGKTVEGIPVVATHQDVVEYVKKNWVDEVLFAIPARDPFPREIMDQLTAMGVTVHMNLDKSSQIVGVKQSVGKVGDLVVISSSLNNMTSRQRMEKRILDVCGGIVGCILTGILYLILAPKIKKESPGPVFFTQTRIGKNGKPFKLYKFRSMYLDAEERKAELMSQNRVENGLMFKMEFDPRVIGNKIDENGNKTTGIGEFIRKYSLDEFPQFYNVLKGDMSLVGTRPPTVEEVAQYEARHKMRLAIKPGITGMWQVSGRSDITDFEEVVRLDTDYIANWSIGLDIKILFKTVSVIFKKEGAM